MTRDEHIDWHKEHHESLWRLFEDHMYHSRETMSNVSALELFNWSFDQTINPTETREEVSDG